MWYLQLIFPKVSEIKVFVGTLLNQAHQLHPYFLGVPTSTCFFLKEMRKTNVFDRWKLDKPLAMLWKVWHFLLTSRCTKPSDGLVGLIGYLKQGAGRPMLWGITVPL